jgi:hypothetical protein
MELESIIKQDEIDRLNEAVNLARDLEYRLDKIKEQVFKMSRNKEPERLVKYKDIVEISSVITLQLVINTKHYNKLQAINRLMILADYYNDGWEPDWKSPSWKYFAVYNKEKDQIQIGLSVYSSHGYVYFKSKELLELAIENNREIFEAALR